ncbi:MAG: acyltransferase family protein [Lachnospiraceae bacterium]
MNRLTKRDEALDAVKGFAILIVMVGHCIVLNGLADPYIYDAIVAIQMPLFMVVSGFVTGRKPLLLTEKPDAKKYLAQFGRRTVSYLLPFFVWLFLTHLTNPIRELKLQLFALDRGLWFLMTLWIITLVTMIASFVADYAAWKVKGGTFGKGILRFLVFCLFVGICYLGFVVQARSGNLFLSPSLTVKYLPFYVAGYLWALYVMPVADKMKKGVVNGIWILAAAGFIYLIVAFDMVVVSDTGTLAAQMAASFLGSFICFYGIYHFAKGKVKKGLSFIGQYTLEIYVLHFRFARLLGIGNKDLQLYSLEALGWVTAAFVVMSVLTALCIFIIKKIWILDLLLFGKKSKK